MAKYVFDERLSFDGEGAVEAMLSRKYFNTAFPTKLIKHSLFDGLRFPETGKYDDIALMYLVLARADNVAYHGLPKYIFSRHDDNNSNWTTDPSKLTADVLIEYLGQYKSRTEWLCERFSDKAETWRYYEWSFMISMLEKIARFQMSDCNGIANDMKSELTNHKDEFICCVQLQDFERKWMEELQL